MSNHRVPGSRAPLEGCELVRAARQGTVDARGVGPSGRYRLRCVVASPWQPARVPAVRYAADEDCLAGCGHTEPAVLARRRRHRLLRELGPGREAIAGACRLTCTPPGWTDRAGQGGVITEVVLPVTIRDLTRQDLPSCAWGVSAWDLARLGRALERAGRGEVDYLAVCPPSGPARGGRRTATARLARARGAFCGSWPSAGPGLVRSRGWEVRRCRPGSLPPGAARGWSFRASEGRSPAT